MSSSKKRPALNLDQFFQPTSAGDDLDFLLSGAPEETAQRAQERGLQLFDLPLDAIAPDLQQLRRLPHPEALRQMAASGDRAAEALLASLYELGRSLREHGQLQPAIVYRDTDPQDAHITHRLFHGQRRWSAALLEGIPTLWVVEVPRPTNVTRLLRQFEENERREGYRDMERAWALIELKEALQAEAGGEVPWSVVEEQLQISSERRHDLLRLLRFSPEGQALILRYGWSEWVLRPLHMAINAHDITPEGATELLQAFAEQGAITTSMVAAVVEDLRRSSSPSVGPARGSAGAAGRTTSRGRISPGMVDLRNIKKLRGTIEQLRKQVPSLDAHARATWLAELEQVTLSLEQLLQDLS